MLLSILNIARNASFKIQSLHTNRNGFGAGVSVLSRRISTINMRETTDSAEFLVAGIAMQSAAEDRIH